MAYVFQYRSDRSHYYGFDSDLAGYQRTQVPFKILPTLKPIVENKKKTSPFTVMKALKPVKKIPQKQEVNDLANIKSPPIPTNMRAVTRSKNTSINQNKPSEKNEEQIFVKTAKAFTHIDSRQQESAQTFTELPPQQRQPAKISVQSSPQQQQPENTTADTTTSMKTKNSAQLRREEKLPLSDSMQDEQTSYISCLSRLSFDEVRYDELCKNIAKLKPLQTVSVTTVANDATSAITQKSAKKVQEFVCSYCDRKFALERTLNLHLLQHCDKIPAAARRKIDSTVLEHVAKAPLPRISNLRFGPQKPINSHFAQTKTWRIMKKPLVKKSSQIICHERWRI